ncbi:MAG: isoprenylcysteine carboxylmethyltransferase family protein, partial [Ruminococcus sp.]|nr:isoprenylcysteine carboxylmethyltransferase family protein [Ruminococcus sp.]
MEKKNEHLPVVGIGPVLCLPVAVVTAAAITASAYGIIPGAVANTAAKTIMFALGILLILEGIALFFGADAGGKLKDQIEENKLKTNGSYRFVRNPCYSLFLLASAGAVLIAHNPFLLVIPALFWSEMT